MSNLGQGVTAVVGGIIGFIGSGGNPLGFAYGFNLGLLAGTALFPTQLPPVFGPRLEDLQTTTAQLGTPVPITWGTIAVPGTVMWLDCPREVSSTEEVGGKGGGSEQEVTTYSYFQSIALGLCEGPIDGVLRIWENGELKYDIRAQQEDETITQYNDRIESSAEYATGFTLYVGTETQEADPTIEAVQGTGNVPAFRGLAYIVYPNRQLRDDQARRHPQFKFEVYRGQLTDPAITLPTLLDGDLTSFSSGELITDWNNDRFFTLDETGAGDTNGIRSHTISTNTEVLQRSFNDLIGEDPSAVWSGCVGPDGDLYLPIETGNSDINIYHFDGETLDLISQGPDPGFSGQWAYSMGIRAEGAGRTEDYLFAASFVSGIFSVYQITGTVISPALNFQLDTSRGHAFVCGYHSDVTGAAGFEGSDTWAYGIATDESSSGTNTGIDFYQLKIEIPPLEIPPLATEISLELLVTVAPADIDETWTRIQELNSVVFDQEDETIILFVRGGRATLGDSNDYLVKIDPSTGDVVWKIPDLWLINSGSNMHSRVGLNRFAFPSSSILVPKMYIVDTGEGTYEEQDWDALLPDDLVTSGVSMYDYVTNCLLTYVASTGPVRACLGLVEPSPVSLATIVSEVSEKCQLTAEDISVADLEDKYVHGYAVGRTMPGRQAIEVLRPIGPFDAVESEGVLKFPVRGGAIVATLSASELGVHESGGEPPPAITTRKVQDVELPQQIRVHYTAHTRDYEPGEQLSAVRLNTDSVNVVDLDVPVALLDDDQAAQIAEMVWDDAWKSRWAHQIALDVSRLELDPADPIIVPVDGRAQRMRIVSIDDSGGLLRRMDLVRDDDGSYVSYAVADAPQRPSGGITILSATELVLLDLPPLRDEDDNAGIYAAVYRSTSGRTWNGAIIFRSSDSGATWSQLVAVANEATVGTLSEALATGISTTWDNANEIEVTLASGSLESRSEEDVLGGANAAAIGEDGRWEIVQFTTAEQVSSTRWRLSGLLRGRRATEHHIGTSEAGDTFVLLSGNGIVRLPLQSSEIGVSRLYRPVSIGTTFSSSDQQEFTGEGEALETFSPVHITGERDDDGNLTITWTRRGRIGQELRSGADIPLSEETEEYEVDILEPGSPDTVSRTLEVTTTTATYTAAQQITDSGSLRSSVRVRVYQLSATVGRGTPGEATI